MRQTVEYPEAQYAATVREVLARASERQTIDGRAWYDDAQSIARAISDRTGRKVETVAAVISALSPRNRWARNVIDAAAYCEAAATGEPMPIAATFGPNMRKAWRIAVEDNPAHLSGRKVESFIANISGDWSRVTVDVWAIRAATNGAEHEVRSDGQYRAIERAYQTVAAEVGMTPAETQAVAWLVCRDEGRVRKSRKVAA